MIKKIYSQMNDYLEYCRFVRQMSLRTIRAKDHTYKHFIVGAGVNKLEDLDNVAFNRYITSQIERGASARTINTRIAHILSWMRWAKEMGVEIPLKVPLVKKLKEGPARRNYYSKEEIMEVLQNTPDELSHLLIRISFDTGLRITELRNLRVHEIHGQRIKFVGKGYKDRETYIGEETTARLFNWVMNHEIKDYLWENPKTGQPYAVDMLRIKMRKAFEACGHTDFYPHALRHSFGSDIQKKGADLFTIQQMMGHSNAETTQRYLHSLDGRLADMFAKYR